MKLVRGHGLGNDYLVLADGQALDAALVRDICHRHTGVGSDGILEPIDGAGSDYGVRIWNPDGSIAEKSGNGLRIYARWLRDGGAPPAFTVWTGFEAVSCEVGDADIAVEMGTAVFDDREPPVPGVHLHVGNPHFVVFAEDFPADWREKGAALENNPHFPNRTNVQFGRVMSRSAVEIRIWERGAGETSASGSSSCAAAAAGVHTDRLDAGDIAVHMPGGVLGVTVRPDRSVRLVGPVEMVGVVEVDARWLAARSTPGG